MIYKASYDTTTKILSFVIVTAIAFIILLTLKQTMIDAGLHGFEAKHALKLLLPVFLLAIIIAAFLFSTKHYAIENNNLLIYRWKDVVIYPLSEITSAKIITAEDTGLVFRTFGVGGLFGYFGKFHSAKLGTLILYTTQNKNRILLKLSSGKKIVISPDDLEILRKF